MKEEALKLADELAFHQGELSMWTRNESCRMIRRLVEELDKHKDMLAKHQDIIADWDKKPLTNEEIAEIYKDFTMFNTPYWFARAIEERHGIK